MVKRNDGAAQPDSWVSFSDILLTLVCAVLYLRVMQSHRKDDLERNREFERRLVSVEQTSAEVEASVRHAALAVQGLSSALEAKRNSQRAGNVGK
jgi:hypothetical protein